MAQQFDTTDATIINFLHDYSKGSKSDFSTVKVKLGVKIRIYGSPIMGSRVNSRKISPIFPQYFMLNLGCVLYNGMFHCINSPHHEVKFKVEQFTSKCLTDFGNSSRIIFAKILGIVFIVR